jgi:hypothetical protein
MECIRNKFTEDIKKNVQERRQVMPAITIMRKAMANYTCFAHNFFKSSAGKELSAGDFYH